MNIKNWIMDKIPSWRFAIGGLCLHFFYLSIAILFYDILNLPAWIFGNVIALIALFVSNHVYKNYVYKEFKYVRKE